jgi:hypothetical protein
MSTCPKCGGPIGKSSPEHIEVECLRCGWMQPAVKRARMIFWKPWVDHHDHQADGQAEGPLDGCLQDAEAFLKEGRIVRLEPLEEPAPAPKISHKDPFLAAALERTAAALAKEEKQPEGHWAACSCPICTGIRDRRYP